MAVLKYKKKDGTYATLTNISVKGVEPVQTTGSSVTDVMSQNAVTVELAKRLAVSDFNTYSGTVNTLIGGKASQGDVNALSGTVTAHTADTTIHVTTSDKEKWDDVTNKVDKIDGKGLSTNDFTTTYKDKLDSVASGAEVNVQSDWAETATTADSYIQNKPTLGTAAARGVSNGISNTDNLIESKHIYSGVGVTISYDSENKRIELKSTSGNVLSSFDASSFIKDGMVSNVEINGGNLVITFNSDSGKEAISIPLTSIFNPNNYYTKDETSGKTEISTALNGKSNTGHTHAISDVTNLQSTLNGKANTATTLSGYGITDAKIANGVITLGSNTITPLTEHQSLSDYYKKAELTGSSTTVVVAKAASATTAANAATADSVAWGNVSDKPNLSSATEVNTALSGKVDKVDGKGLSTNDYTTDEKNKLGGIASNAQVNVIESVKVNGTALTVTNKAVDVTVPTKTSQITNDSNFAVDASYVHTDNNYTTNDKNKLSGIASGAEVNQNAFSNIKVGSTTIAADSKTDTLEISGSGIVTVTADATNDKITISASNAVTSVAGKTGAVTLEKSDVGLGNVDNTADANKTVKAATSAATADTAKAVALANVTGADDIKSIEALTGTSGLLKKTAANTWTLDTNSYSTTAVAVTGATYNSTNKSIELKNAAGTVVSTVDATAFIKDGMVDNVEVKDVPGSGTCLVITFNTEAGKDAINIPISKIFNASNYFTKDDLTGSSTTVVVTKANSANTASTVALAGVTGLQAALNNKADNSALTAHTASSVHMSATEKTNLDSLATNIAAISGITSTKVGNWDGAATNSHTHSNKSTLDAITASATAINSLTGAVGTMAFANAASYSSATEVETALADKSDTGHTHAFSTITNKPTTLGGYGITDAISSVTTSSTNGNISVNGSNVAVHGLGGAAYLNTGTTNGTVAAGDHTHSQYITAITSGDVTSALGYTPTQVTYTSVTLSGNLTNVTCPVTLVNDGDQCNVLYINNSSDHTISVSTNYKTADNKQINLTVKASGYAEVNYMKFGNDIYVRGV